MFDVEEFILSCGTKNKKKILRLYKEYCMLTAGQRVVLFHNSNARVREAVNALKKRGDETKANLLSCILPDSAAQVNNNKWVGEQYKYINKICGS